MNIKKFIQEKITLDKEHREKISQEYKNFKEDFEGKLSNGRSYGAIVTRQGSVATSTAIKPLKSEDKFDLDIAILVSSTGQNEEFDIAVDLKEFADTQYKGKINRIAFQTSRGILDIDLVPMFGEIDGKQRVYNTQKNYDAGKVESDNLNLRDDFNVLAKESAGMNNNALREAVMLAKYAFREHGIKGVPSIVLNCLAMGAPKSLDYKQAMVNYLTAMVEELKLNKGYIHNPSNGVHIEYKNGDEAAEILIQLLDSIIEDNKGIFSRVIKSAGVFFAGAAATVGSVAASTAKVVGGSASYAGEKDFK